MLFVFKKKKFLKIHCFTKILFAGARVVLACRNTELAEKVVKEVRGSCDNINVTALHCDLSSLDSVRAFAEEFKKRMFFFFFFFSVLDIIFFFFISQLLLLRNILTFIFFCSEFDTYKICI